MSISFEQTRQSHAQAHPWPGRLWPWLGLLAVLLLAAWLRLETLAQRPYWYDELFTLAVARDSGSLAEVWGIAAKDGGEHPPLYYALAHIAYKSFGSIASLRAPALVAGVLAVGALYWLVWGMLGFVPALTGAVLMAASVYAVEYSQDARSYMLLVLEGALLWIFLEYYLRTLKAKWLVAFGVTVLASLYTHHLALLYLPFIAVLVLGALYPPSQDLPDYRRRVCWGLAIAMGLVALFFLPQLRNLMDYAAMPRPEQAVVLNLNLELLREVLGRWGLGSRIAPLFVVFLLIGVIRCYRFGMRGLALLVWLVTPFLFFALFPFQKFFDVRFLITALVPFYILCGSGMEMAAWILERNRVNKLVGVAGILLVFFLLWARPYSTFRQSRDRCSNFFQYPELLSRDDGFCEKYLILNSLNPNQAWIVKPR